MGELSDLDIDKLMSSETTMRKRAGFSGCFLSDELSSMSPEQNKCYIINLASSKKPNEDGSYGTHWTAIFNELKNRIIYFDPFGLPPNKDTLAFLKRAKRSKDNKSKEVLYNTLQIQDMDSEDCGWFCVYILKQLLARRTFLNILMDDFETRVNLFKNDKVVEKITKSEYINFMK